MNISDKYKSPFAFHGFRVKNMQFTTNESCEGENFQADFDLDSSITYSENVEERFCTISLYASLFKKFAAEGKEYPFILEVTVDGYFSALKRDFTTENFSKIAEKNGVAILFPYLRSIFCDASKMANVPPVLIPSINIVELLRYKREMQNLIPSTDK